MINKIFNPAKSSKESMMSSNLYNGIYIPERFKKTVLRHLLLNYSEDINGHAPPLFLAIQGSKGEGKSFMIEKLCKYYSIEYIPVSGAQLCGNLEGDSIKELMAPYESACVEAASSGKLHCMVIDDFHKSIAAIEGKNITATTNTSVLIGRLMNLADNPYVHGVRIPIIFTGNEFSSIYSALTRHGRMDFFDWVPTIQEKKDMVYHMFAGFFPSIPRTATDKLVESYPDKYIAFFKVVVQSLVFDNLEDAIDEFCGSDNKNLQNITYIVKRSIDKSVDISSRNILATAKAINEHMPKNYD